MKKLSLLLSALMILSLLCFNFTACSSEAIYSEGDGELHVLCTTFAPFDFVRQVGGDRVKVSILQDSGADLHNYTPTAATLSALSDADLFVCIGGSSDNAWLPDAVNAAGNSSLKTLCLIDSVEPMYASLEDDWSGEEHSHEGDHDDHGHGHSHDGHDHGADEHIWTSVKNAMLMVEAIKDALIEADPEGREIYENNAADYLARLTYLDAQLEELEGEIPLLLMADRFPFVYLLHDYHIPYVAAFSGCSTEVNAGFETQIKLIEAVRDNSISTIFVIDGGSKDLADAISSETGCAIAALDSMQSIDRSHIISGANYIDIMQKNINILKEAY